MQELYFTQDEKVIEVVDANLLNKIIHASFAEKLNTIYIAPAVKQEAVEEKKEKSAEEEAEELVREALEQNSRAKAMQESLEIIKRDAKKDLEEILQLESQPLANFIPSGSPFFANAGHNGYTLSGVRPKFYGFTNNSGEESLMSAAFIGSSANVYIPMIGVKKRTRTLITTPKSLPHFMIYNGKDFVEAKYNIKTACFFEAENAQPIDPNSLSILNIQQEGDYIKNNNLPSPPANCRRFQRNLERVRFGAMNSLSLIEKLKDYCRDIVFSGIYMSSFYEQLKYHFSTKGQLLKSIMPNGGKYNSWITEEQISSFSHASYEEIKVAVQELLSEPYIEDFTSLTFTEALNHFLLYKTLDKKKGNFLVGAIQGDSYNIHIPYAQVEIRKK